MPKKGFGNMERGQANAAKLESEFKRNYLRILQPALRRGRAPNNNAVNTTMTMTSDNKWLRSTTTGGCRRTAKHANRHVAVKQRAFQTHITYESVVLCLWAWGTCCTAGKPRSGRQCAAQNSRTAFWVWACNYYGDAEQLAVRSRPQLSNQVATQTESPCNQKAICLEPSLTIGTAEHKSDATTNKQGWRGQPPYQWRIMAGVFRIFNRRFEKEAGEVKTRQTTAQPTPCVPWNSLPMEIQPSSTWERRCRRPTNKRGWRRLSPN